MSVSPVRSRAPRGARSGALERLYDLNRGDVILKASGRDIPVGLELRSLAEAMDSSVLPTAVVKRVMEAQRDGKKFTDEELAEIADEALKEEASGERLREFVARSVRTLWGEPVEMAARDTSQFTDDEFTELLRYCTREEPLPGKA